MANRITFIKELAHFLVANQILMSMRLERGDEQAKAWARLRATTPLFGYPTIAEAEEQLAEWLWKREEPFQGVL